MSATQFRQNHTGKKVHAIAGIGHPQRFFAMLESLKIESTNHAFPDHHLFSLKDFELAEPGSAIIMTEKDAVKCRSLGLKNAWYVPVDTHLEESFEVTFKQRLLGLMKECK
jgi:tetraacyldisaccharide 4'-kinase